MAQITWRNVDAPDLSRSSRILNDAVSNFAGGFNNASAALLAARDRQKSNRSAEVIDDLARVRDEAGVDPFLTGISGMINARDMTPELQQAILNLRGAAQGYDTTRLNQEGIRARTASTNAASARASAAAAREIAKEDQLAALAAPYLNAALQEGGMIEGTPSAGTPGDTVPIPNELPLSMGGTPAGASTVNPWQAVLDQVSGSNLVSPMDVQELLTTSLSNANSAQSNRDADRQRDFNFEGEATKRSRDEETYRIGMEASERAYGILPGIRNVQEGIDTVMNMEGLSDREKAETINQIRGYATANPEYFSANSGLPANTATELAVAQMQANQSFNNATDGGIQSLQMVGAASGEGTQTVLQQLESIRALENVELGGTDNDIVSAVNEVASEYGVDPSVVMRVAQNTLSGRPVGSGKVFINKTQLRNAMSAYGSREDFQRVKAQQELQSKRIEEAQSLAQQEMEQQQIINVMSRRSGPEAERQLAAAQENLVQIQERLGQVLAADNQANPPSVTPGPSAAEELAQSVMTTLANTGGGAQAPTIPANQLPETPGGNVVDPSATQFNQLVQGVARSSEIKQTLGKIQTNLALDGGAPAAQLADSIRGFFTRTPEEQASVRQLQGQKSEALEWYYSQAAISHFNENPLDLTEAEKDPVGFYLNNIQQ